MPAGATATATVLVVDDDDLVRAVTVRMVKRLGYDVLEADAATSALEVSRNHPGTIALLVSDILLGDGEGPALFETIKKERPDIRSLFMSGKPAAAPDEGVLAKPFTLDDLRKRLQELVG